MENGFELQQTLATGKSHGHLFTDKVIRGVHITDVLCFGSDFCCSFEHYRHNLKVSVKDVIQTFECKGYKMYFMANVVILMGIFKLYKRKPMFMLFPSRFYIFNQLA